jgi:hypothetical protein
VLFPAAVLLVLWGAIRPEERFMHKRFGAAHLASRLGGDIPRAHSREQVLGLGCADYIDDVAALDPVRRLHAARASLAVRQWSSGSTQRSGRTRSR